MELNIKRLLISLNVIGFHFLRSQRSGTILYSRSTCHKELSEWLFIDFAGKNKEAVSVSRGISVIHRAYPIKGLIYEVHIEQIAENKERLWTIVDSDQTSLSFENKLLNYLTANSDTLIDEGKQLLEKTVSLRSIADRYWEKLSAVVSLKYWYKSSDRDAELKVRAQELSHKAGVCWLPNGFWLYEVAIYIVLEHSLEIEGKVHDLVNQNEMPVSQKEILQLLGMLVDKIVIKDNLSRW